jgi:murein DD-endopeptidase MepM/ murein hydrolase activator NlpD
VRVGIGLGVLVLACTVHGLWAQRQVHIAQQLVHQNAALRALTQELERQMPKARDATALAERNFVQVWTKSGLGLEPGLLDVLPAVDAVAAEPEDTAPNEGEPPEMISLEGPTASHDVSTATAALIPIVELEPESLPEAARHLTAEGRELSTTLGDTLEYFHDAERMLLNTPSIRPAHTAWYSSSFGIRIHPITHVLLMHKGLDMGGYTGMEIFAPADGVVIWIGRRGGYGQVVVIDHGYGLQTHFAHLSKYLVKAGQHVKRGQRIAEMGTTGHSTGPHVHYEVRRFGQVLDPRRFILD